VVVAELRDEEVLCVTAVIVGGQVKPIDHGVADEFGAADWTKPLQADVEAIAETHHSCGVHAAANGVLDQSDANTAHTLGFLADTVRGVTVSGPDTGCKQGYDSDCCQALF